MSIHEDFLGYFDGNGLLAPNPAPKGTIRGSDNGPMYTSEYYMMLEKTAQLTGDDVLIYETCILNCIKDGLLNRAPGDSDQEGPDDHYGVLAGCKVLGITSIPRTLLKSVFRYKGFLNNNQPGVKTWDSFLVRQPQMIAAMVAASFPSKLNPLHWLARLAAFPFFLVAAISIAISCIGADPGDGDSRRLSWHLIQSTRPVSFMCWFASVIWYDRLHSTYGWDGMRAVAAIYYQPKGDNPYSRNWVTY